MQNMHTSLMKNIMWKIFKIKQWIISNILFYSHTFKIKVIIIIILIFLLLYHHIYLSFKYTNIIKIIWTIFFFCSLSLSIFVLLLNRLILDFKKTQIYKLDWQLDHLRQHHLQSFYLIYLYINNIDKYYFYVLQKSIQEKNLTRTKTWLVI